MDSDLEYSSDLFSTDSSDEDYDFLEIVTTPITRTVKGHFLGEVVPNYDDTTFLNYFRVSRCTVKKIVDLYSQSTYYKEDRHGHYGKILAIDQVLIFLWFVGHRAANYREGRDKFKISLSSLHRIVKRLTFFLSNLSPEIIKWPNEEEKKITETYFKEKGFPNVIGAIGGIHIKIDKPENDPDSYINQEGYYSIQMQAVCNHEYKVLDIFVGYPGSAKNSQVFMNSPLSESLQEKCSPYYLLGDSEYPLLKNLLTPFKKKEIMTERQLTYNFKLSQSQCIIEDCFRIIKQKFRQLYHIKFRNIPLIVHFIRACCVLHNIALKDGFMFIAEERIFTEELFTADTEDESEDDLDAKVIRESLAGCL